MGEQNGEVVVAHMIIHEFGHKSAGLDDWAYATEDCGKKSEMESHQNRIQTITKSLGKCSIKEKNDLLSQLNNPKNAAKFRKENRPWKVPCYPSLTHKECMNNADSVAIIVTEWSNSIKGK